ncbi:MAG: hypothetical protein QOG87_889 [Actinomycetota bacterium]|jgi:hypothetical protein
MNFVEYITELLRDAGRLTGFLDSPRQDMAAHGFGNKSLADAREAMSLARVGADDDNAFRRLDSAFARSFGAFAGSDADVANISDGSASLRTGDVNVQGASGPSIIEQSQNIGRGGINTGDQAARIDNDTNVRANTGGNTVIGNASRNTNIVDQDAAAIGGRGGRGGAVASNQADVSNVSDGTASLRTGDVNVSGASGPNVIDQSSNVGRGGINTGDQTAIIDNDTNVSANTGGNTVIGNASRNTNIVDQDAVGIGGRGGRGGAVASNQANVSNVSDGTATLRTGDVNVSGASGPNVIDQSSNVGRGGINTGDQTAVIDNDTNVRANTGGNTVIGNASRNTNIVDQDAVGIGGRGGRGGAIASNQADVSNVSDGSASLRTGDVNVSGASGPNVIDQSSNVGRGGINTGDQTARIDNDTNVRANTGGNTVIGNASRNTNVVDQDAVSLGGRAAPAATAAAAVYGVEGELDDGGQPTAYFNKMGDQGAMVDPDADVQDHGQMEANTGGNPSGHATEMTPANAPFAPDDSISGSLPGAGQTPLWEPGMGTTPTPPADPSPSPSGQPSPSPSPVGQPDDTFQHSPLSPAPGGQSMIDSHVDGLLAQVDGYVDGLDNDYGGGVNAQVHMGNAIDDHVDVQLAQAGVGDDGYGTGHVDVGSDADMGTPHDSAPSPAPSASPSPMPDPDPAPSASPNPSPMPSPSPAPVDPDGLDEFDSFDKRNEHSSADDHGSDPMDHDDFDDIG